MCNNSLQSKHMELLIHRITWDLRHPLIYDAPPLFKKMNFQGGKKIFASKYFSLSMKFIILIARPLFFEENNVFKPFKK